MSCSRHLDLNVSVESLLVLIRLVGQLLVGRETVAYSLHEISAIIGTRHSYADLVFVFETFLNDAPAVQHAFSTCVLAALRCSPKY